MAILPFRIGRDGTASCRMGGAGHGSFFVAEKTMENAAEST